MVRTILNEEIISLFKKKKGWTEQTIRDKVSQLKIKHCQKATQNAAAHILGLIEGIKVWGKLKQKDRDSLPSNVNEIVARYSKNSQRRGESKPKQAPSFKRKINNSQDTLEKDAYTNASIYSHIFLLENKLREVILKKFKSNNSWWSDTKIVKKDIQEYAERIQKAENKYKWVDARGNHPIYYVNLEHLFKIIEKNWNDFKKIFNDLGHLRTWIAECIPVRNLIAHNIKTKKPERDDLIKSSRKICKLIDKKEN